MSPKTVRYGPLEEQFPVRIPVVDVKPHPSQNPSQPTMWEALLNHTKASDLGHLKLLFDDAFGRELHDYIALAEEGELCALGRISKKDSICHMVFVDPADSRLMIPENL